MWVSVQRAGLQAHALLQGALGQGWAGRFVEHEAVHRAVVVREVALVPRLARAGQHVAVTVEGIGTLTSLAEDR